MEDIYVQNPEETPKRTATATTLGVFTAPNSANTSAAELARAGRSIVYTPHVPARKTGRTRPRVLPALRIASCSK